MEKKQTPGYRNSSGSSNEATENKEKRCRRPHLYANGHHVLVRGMEYGEQTLSTNDLFVHLPAQIMSDLVVAMERQDFTPAQVKGSYGYDPKKKELKTTLCSLWKCTRKKLLTTDSPECRIRPGLKDLALVVPLTRL